MMRSLLPLLLLVSTSAYAAVPIKWSETLVKNLNTKTLRQAFCEKNVGFRAQAMCDEFSREKGFLDQRVSSARVEGSSLFITVSKRTVEIKTTPNTNVFEINRRIIDLRNYAKPGDLVKALRAAFPRVASGSLWMNSAYAKETPLELLMGASAAMLMGTSDANWCTYAENFIRACSLNVSESPDKEQWSYLYKKIKAEEPLDADDWRWVEADSQNFIVLAHQMKGVVAGLSRSDVQDALRRCPSSNVPPLKNAQEDVLRCEKVLAIKKAISKEIPGIVRTQQETLATKPTKPEQIKIAKQFREEVVAWMVYISSNEKEFETPEQLLKPPVK